MNPLKAIMPSSLSWGYQIGGTLLATASLTTLCWYLSQNGLLDLAATGLSFFLVTVTRQLAPSLSDRAPSEFSNSANILDALRADFAAWMSHRRILGHVLIGLAATVLFLVCRFFASTVLTMIASPWLALALGLAVAAAVASPILIRALIDTVKTNATTLKGVTND